MFSSLGQSGHKNSDYANLLFLFHLISVSESHSLLWIRLIWPLTRKFGTQNSIKKDKVEEIVDGIKRCKATKKPGIDFFLSSNLCLSSLPRKIRPPSQSREAQKTRQLSSRCSSLRFKIIFDSLVQDGKRKIDFVLVFEVIQLRSRFPWSSHFIGKISTQKEDKKDAALCLLPKELEGTDIGVAAAAQAFKWVQSLPETLSHLLLRCATNQPNLKPPQDIITYLHHSLQLHFSPAPFALVWPPSR